MTNFLASIEACQFIHKLFTLATHVTENIQLLFSLAFIYHEFRFIQLKYVYKENVFFFA